MNKTELLQQLKKIEDKEKEEKENRIKEENYIKFINRPEDYMVGKAHCDLEFIGKTCLSDRLESVFPESVSITGNSGTTFQGKIPMTKSSKTFYRNIWDDGKIDYERAFEKELVELTKKYVDLVCNDISCKLELMGLQSTDYYVSENYFPTDKLNEVLKNIEDARAEILNKYQDDEIMSLFYEYNLYDDNGVIIGSKFKTGLCHSNMILYRYIFKHRQNMRDFIAKTEYYQRFEETITK